MNPVKQNADWAFWCRPVGPTICLSKFKTTKLEEKKNEVLRGGGRVEASYSKIAEEPQDGTCLGTTNVVRLRATTFCLRFLLRRCRITELWNLYLLPFGRLMQAAGSTCWPTGTPSSVDAVDERAPDTRGPGPQQKQYRNMARGNDGSGVASGQARWRAYPLFYETVNDISTPKVSRR